MTTDLTLEDISGKARGQMTTLGWMDDIVEFTFGSNVLAINIGVSSVTPSNGTDIFPLSGLPVSIPNILVPLAKSTEKPPFPNIVDPLTAAMLGTYTIWTVPGSLVVFTHSGSANVVIPVNKFAKKTDADTKFSLSMPCPGYGSQFVITKKQTVYVPWNTNEGVTFPGSDIDQFGNIFPIRAHGINANDNGTLIVSGSPSASPIFFDSGWGAWTTLAQSNQQCAALNTSFGASVNYVSFAWEVWFTQYCGDTVLFTARTFKYKDIKSKKFDDFFNNIPYISQVSLLFQSGHGQRVANWGFIDPATGNGGVGKTVTISGDTKTLQITGATS